MYVVVVCYSCGKLLLAKVVQKTRRCPYCETRITLQRTKKVARVKTAQEASDCIRFLKKERNR